MLIAMTGATGFIGSHIALRLREAGHDVRALVRSSSRTETLNDAGDDILVGDLNDRKFLRKGIQGCDIVINVAGCLGKWGVSEGELHAVNVAAVKDLLEVLHDSGIKQFIHFSTPGVVGMVGVAPECMPMRPAGAYERTKCQAEKLVLGYHKSGGVPVTVLRPDFVYGPGDLHKLRMFLAIKEQRFPMLGGGKSLLHPTYIDDVVNGTMLTLNNQEAYGQVFNLAGPSPVTVRQLTGLIADELKVDVRGLPVPPVLLKLCAFGVESACSVMGKEPPVTRQQIKFFTRDHASDISKAQSILGYQPGVELQEGIRRTIAWYRQEGCL